MNVKRLKLKHNVKLLQTKKNVLGNMEYVQNKKKYVHFKMMQNLVNQKLVVTLL